MNDRYRGGERQRRDENRDERGRGDRNRSGQSDEGVRERVAERLRGEQAVIPIGGQPGGRAEDQPDRATEGMPRQETPGREQPSFRYGGDSRHGARHNPPQQEFGQEPSQQYQQQRSSQSQEQPAKQPHQQPSPQQQRAQQSRSQQTQTAKQRPSSRQPSQQGGQQRRRYGSRELTDPNFRSFGTQRGERQSQRTGGQRTGGQQSRRRESGRRQSRSRNARSREVTQQQDFGMSEREQRRAPDIGGRRPPNASETSERGGRGDTERRGGERRGASREGWSEVTREQAGRERSPREDRDYGNSY